MRVWVKRHERSDTNVNKRRCKACNHCPFYLTGFNGDILYSLMDSTDGYFSIDEHTGVVSLERLLDRDVQSVYELKARATDQGSPHLTALCQVIITVLDINDNPPVFEHREYTATVSEDVAVGTQVIRVQATSRDTEAIGEISYSIISGNEHGLFSVDPHTGNYQLSVGFFFLNFFNNVAVE